MQKITPFIWFKENAEEAMEFYVSLFKDSKVMNVTRMSDNVPGPAGKVIMGTFQIAGMEFYALNGGPTNMLKGAGPISLFVSCEDQVEIDHYWTAFLEGGTPVQCGWITDKYGVTWQIVPKILGQLMGDPDRTKAERVSAAMLKMIKLDIAELQKAYDGN